jgi:ligand-binding sensor domain-containing protein
MKFTHYNGQQLDNIKALAFDGQRLWIATHGKGLFSCDEKGGVWTSYTTANSNIPSDYVHAVAVAPDGKIWAGTLSGGAASFDQVKRIWKTYTRLDGMVDNDVTAIAFEGRYIWFGTLNGGVSVMLNDS